MLVGFLDAFFFLCSIYVLVMRIMISYHFGYLREILPVNGEQAYLCAQKANLSLVPAVLAFTFQENGL